MWPCIEFGYGARLKALSAAAAVGVVLMPLQFEGALMLDWPLIAIMSLTPDGDTPHLVLQAKREMQAATGQYMIWTSESLQID
jgi:hypothetical protein